MGFKRVRVMEIKKSGSELLKKTATFLKEVEIEFKKVVWPDRKFVFAATVIVLVIVLSSAAYVMAVDWGLAKVFDFLTAIFRSGV